MEAEERFRQIFVEGYPVLQRYARHRGLAQPDADDLVAEVLTVAWRKLGAIPVADPVPWLIAVARNVWRNNLRAGARRNRLLARLPPPEPVAAPSERGGVAAAMARLRPDDQEVLRLVAWDGLTPAQITTVLGCSPTAARVRIHRARARLAAELGREADHEAQPDTEPRQRSFEEERDVTHHR